MGGIKRLNLRCANTHIYFRSLSIFCGFNTIKNFKCFAMMDWYSLRVISGKEKKIRDSLLVEVEREGYSAKVGQVFVP